MQYQCFICERVFESDYHGWRIPKYCKSCKEMPDSDDAIVYGLHAGDGHIRYVGSTGNPVRRLYSHRYPDKYEDHNPRLAAWVRKIGSDNLRMQVLMIVKETEMRQWEEIELRKRDGLLNYRAAKPKVYTKEEAHDILAARFQK